MNDTNIILTISGIICIIFAFGMLYLTIQSLERQIRTQRYMKIYYHYNWWILFHILIITLLAITMFLNYYIFLYGSIDSQLGQIVLYSELIAQIVFLIGFMWMFHE